MDPIQVTVCRLCPDIFPGEVASCPIDPEHELQVVDLASPDFRAWLELANVQSRLLAQDLLARVPPELTADLHPDAEFALRWLTAANVLIAQIEDVARRDQLHAAVDAGRVGLTDPVWIQHLFERGLDGEIWCPIIVADEHLGSVLVRALDPSGRVISDELIRGGD